MAEEDGILTRIMRYLITAEIKPVAVATKNF